MLCQEMSGQSQNCYVSRQKQLCTIYIGCAAVLYHELQFYFFEAWQVSRSPMHL